METGQKSEKKKRSSVQMVLQILVLALIGAGIGLYITSLGRSPEILDDRTRNGWFFGAIAGSILGAIMRNLKQILICFGVVGSLYWSRHIIYFIFWKSMEYLVPLGSSNIYGIFVFPLISLLVLGVSTFSFARIGSDIANWVSGFLRKNEDPQSRQKISEVGCCAWLIGMAILVSSLVYYLFDSYFHGELPVRTVARVDQNVGASISLPSSSAGQSLGQSGVQKIDPNEAELNELPFVVPVLTDLHFSPDGSHLLSVDSIGRANIWNLATGDSVAGIHKKYSGTGAPFKHSGFAADGSRFFTIDRKGLIETWDSRNGKKVKEFLAFAKGEFLEQFGVVGHLSLMVGRYGTIKVWDARKETLTEMQGFVEANEQMYVDQTIWAFSPDGRLFAAASIGSDQAKIWEVETGSTPIQMRNNDWELGGINTMKFSPDGKKLAAGCSNNRSTIWETQTGKPLVQIPGPMTEVRAIAFSPDGAEIATAASHHLINISDSVTGKNKRKIQFSFGEIKDLEYAPGGKMLVVKAGYPGVTSTVLDLDRGRPVASHQGNGSIQYSQDGKSIAGLFDGNGFLQLWDFQKSTKLLELATGWNKPGVSMIATVKFSPQGKLLALYGPDGVSVQLWETASGKKFRNLDCFPKPSENKPNVSGSP